MVTQETQVHILTAFHDGNKFYAISDGGSYTCSHWPKGRWYESRKDIEKLSWDSPTILSKGLDQW